MLFRSREKRELDVEIAIRRGTLELLGKGPGADPENLTSREKAICLSISSPRNSEQLNTKHSHRCTLRLCFYA